MRRFEKKMYSIGEIIGTYIANVEYAYDEAQGDYSFDCLIAEAVDVLFEMCDFEGLNADKVLELADTKLAKMCKDGVLIRG